MPSQQSSLPVNSHLAEPTGFKQGKSKIVDARVSNSMSMTRPQKKTAFKINKKSIMSNLKKQN